MNVAIITARGGSKSIPHKNLYPINGKPLVAYAARAALDAKKIDYIFIDTDDGQSQDNGGRRDRAVGPTTETSVPSVDPVGSVPSAASLRQGLSPAYRRDAADR